MAAQQAAPAVGVQPAQVLQLLSAALNPAHTKEAEKALAGLEGQPGYVSSLAVSSDLGPPDRSWAPSAAPDSFSGRLGTQSLAARTATAGAAIEGPCRGRRPALRVLQRTAGYAACS